MKLNINRVNNRCLKANEKNQCVYLIQGDCEGCQVYRKAQDEKRNCKSCSWLEDGLCLSKNETIKDVEGVCDQYNRKLKTEISQTQGYMKAVRGEDVAKKETKKEELIEIIVEAIDDFHGCLLRRTIAEGILNRVEQKYDYVKKPIKKESIFYMVKEHFASSHDHEIEGEKAIALNRAKALCKKHGKKYDVHELKLIGSYEPDENKKQ